MGTSTTGGMLAITGLADDWRVQRCRAVAAELCSTLAENDYEIQLMLEAEWEAFLGRRSLELGCAGHSKSPLVMLRCGEAQTYVGGLEELESLAEAALRRPPAPSERKAHEKKARALYLERLVGRRRQYAFLDVRFNAAASNAKPKKIVIELFTDLCPRTCNSFVALCTGERGPHYRDTAFHRVVAGGWVQGGDVAGCECFADESFAVSFDRPGLVAMATNGPHTNASQFFITLAPQPWLDNAAVAFGVVVKGMAVVRQIGRLKTANDVPLEECRIVSCGVSSLDDGFGLF